MQVNSLKIAKVFSSGGDIHYVLPLFQREYTWEKSNWDTLLTDIFAIYGEYVDENVPEHFMGSLVVIEDGNRNGVIPAFRLVDGQQRLTTISLLLSALGQLVKPSHPTLTNKINRLLLNADETGEVRYKLYPTTKYGDRDCYTALLDGLETPSNQSRVVEAHRHLYRELERKIASGEIDPERLFVVVTTALQVVLITLNSGENPYQIFESLNAKGKPLTQADLVRNYIAMKVTALDQERLYTQHWAKIEALLQEQRMVGRFGLGELTAFLRHYGAMHSGALANQNHVYARFRDRIESQFKQPGEIIAEMETLHRFARYYATFLRPENESDSQIRHALKRLNIMDAATAYPFLLALFEARHIQKISREELLEALQVLENYLVRRYLVGESTNSLNRLFPTLWKALKPDSFISSMKTVLANRGYPGDHRIRQSVKTREFYENRSGSRDKLVMVLSTLDDYLSRHMDVSHSLRGDATIEHVLPQTPPSDWKQKWKDELGDDWQQFEDDYLSWQTELGEEWEQIYRESLHTLGNLTLVTQRWQVKLSNKPFAIKKGLLAAQGLPLNKYFEGEVNRWDETAIRERASQLTDIILEVWPGFASALVVGSENGESANSGTNNIKRDWDEESTFSLLEAKAGPEAVEVARKILDWARLYSVQIWWSVNSTEGSYIPYFYHYGREHQLFVVRASGVLETYFQWYQNKPAFAPEEKRLELLRRLNAIPGFALPLDSITRRPSFPLTILSSDSALSQFLKTFEWFIAEVQQTAPEPEDETANNPASGTVGAIQLGYWTAFAEHLEQSDGPLKPQVPRAQKWMSFAIGRSYFETVVEINVWDKIIGASLQIYGPDRFTFFHQLHDEKMAIEADLQLSADTEMIWGELPESKICRIQLIRLETEASQVELWPEQHAWLRQNLETLHRVFKSRIKALVV